MSRTTVVDRAHITTVSAASPASHGPSSRATPWWRSPPSARRPDPYRPAPRRLATSPPRRASIRSLLRFPAGCRPTGTNVTSHNAITAVTPMPECTPTSCTRLTASSRPAPGWSVGVSRNSSEPSASRRRRHSRHQHNHRRRRDRSATATWQQKPRVDGDMSGMLTAAAAAAALTD